MFQDGNPWPPPPLQLILGTDGCPELLLSFFPDDHFCYKVLVERVMHWEDAFDCCMWDTVETLHAYVSNTWEARHFVARERSGGDVRERDRVIDAVREFGKMRGDRRP